MLLMLLFQDAFWALSALMSDDKYSMHGEFILIFLFLIFTAVCNVTSCFFLEI